MAFTDEQIFNWLQSNPSDDLATLSAMQEFGVSPEQIARVTGLSADDVNARIEDVIGSAYTGQYGREATDAEIANAWTYLNQGGLVDPGIANINRTEEGYNYDTQDIIAAYRQAYGRNPTQEEYVAAMATLGIDQFDRESLVGAGNFTSAQLNALEADPYAGRYAGYNPYEVNPENFPNVSTNVLGDYVQFISPVTQRPAIASFENGQLVVRDGQDVFTGAQANAAIALASAAGLLTNEEYEDIYNQLDKAKSIEDVYRAFSTPQAFAAFDPVFGAQTGAGRTLSEAQANSQQMNALIAALGLQNGGVMPGNPQISDAARANGIPYQFDSRLYEQLYGQMKPYTSKDVITPDNFQSKLPGIIGGAQLGRQTGLNIGAGSGGGKLQNLGVFGAAGNQMTGSGNADYQSSLIETLRDSNTERVSNNAGVTMYGYAPGGSNASMLNLGGNTQGGPSAFNPGIQTIAPASQQDITDSNAYNAYRISAIKDPNAEVLGFEEWLAQQGSPKPEPIIGGTTGPEQTFLESY